MGKNDQAKIYDHQQPRPYRAAGIVGGSVWPMEGDEMSRMSKHKGAAGERKAASGLYQVDVHKAALGSPSKPGMFRYSAPRYPLHRRIPYAGNRASQSTGFPVDADAGLRIHHKTDLKSTFEPNNQRLTGGSVHHKARHPVRANVLSYLDNFVRKVFNIAVLQQ